MSLISLTDATKRYKVGGSNEVNALHGVTLTIEKGEMTSVMGPSGSGKSTFMNILGCLDRPTSGRYLLDGADVGQLGRDELAAIRNKKIGFVFQGFNLLQRATALENVELPLLYNGTPSGERKKKALEALSSVGLSGRENHHPNQLSGGQQQRVAIARAVITGAAIILADEPTGNLDTKTGSEIMDLFSGLNRESGITIIVVTHEAQIADYCRRVIRFLDGKITSDEVRA